MNLYQIILLSTFCFFNLTYAQRNSFKPGVTWPDNNNAHINAHGGGILNYLDKYYWFGEFKSPLQNENSAVEGITCYSSYDLYNWKNEGVVLPVAVEGSGSDIEKYCIMERPKVIYNKLTSKFVMYFHLELKGHGYDAAKVGIAFADSITGPYTYLRSLNPNAGYLPISYVENEHFLFDAYLLRDYKTGNKSRDMTLFVDEDQKAYHIFSSEDNATIHVALLSDDYLSYSGKYERIAPGGYNESPAIFKREGRYFMITSGTTGWAPNAARTFTSTNIMGPWKEYRNPCLGTDANTTFNSQSTYILPVKNLKDAYIYMGDRWNPTWPSTATYVWLPMQFKNGLPVLKWINEWDLGFFTNTFENLQNDISSDNSLLSIVTVGDKIKEYSQEAYNAFSTAIQTAGLINESASEVEISDGIIKLSNAAATFRDAKNPREINTLEDGKYYIKTNNLYLTNSTDIQNDQKLRLEPIKITDTQAQVFEIMKQSSTGRYKIISNMDGRNINEYISIRNDWGWQDQLWRTVDIHFNGSNYALQNDGNSVWTGIWKFNNQTNQLEPSGKSSLSIDSEIEFIFSLEKVPVANGVSKTDEFNFSLIVQPHTILVKTDEPISVKIYTNSGLLINQFEISRNTYVDLKSGFYIIQMQSQNGCKKQKIIVN